jgi:hypothetical protein
MVTNLNMETALLRNLQICLIYISHTKLETPVSKGCLLSPKHKLNNTDLLSKHNTLTLYFRLLSKQTYSVQMLCFSEQ